ncbi:hypothetical protein ACROYT_G014390 [Oculina patagonica]
MTDVPSKHVLPAYSSSSVISWNGQSTTLSIVRYQDNFVLVFSSAVRMNTQAAKEHTMQNVGRGKSNISPILI